MDHSFLPIGIEKESEYGKEIPESFQVRYPDLMFYFMKPKEGSRGKVYFLCTKDGDKLCVLKINKTINSRIVFMKEAETMFEQESPCTVSLIDYQFDSDCKERWILMDYIPGIELSKCQNILCQRKVPTFKILYGTMRALYYFNKKYIHRDLTPVNILVDCNLNPHIIDFGEQKRIEGEEVYSNFTPTHGDIHIVPPEAHAEKRVYTRKYDIYSYAYSFISSFTDVWERNEEIPEDFNEQCGECIASLLSNCKCPVLNRLTHIEVIGEIQKIAKQELTEDELEEFDEYCREIDNYESVHKPIRQTYKEFVKIPENAVKSPQRKNKLYSDYLNSSEPKELLLGKKENYQKLLEIMKRYDIKKI
jgi:serine/threonine protein kinase